MSVPELLRRIAELESALAAAQAHIDALEAWKQSVERVWPQIMETL